MTLQTLCDKLSELRLSAFREALRDQQANSQYSDLVFEDRLSLLVETECTQRREKRIWRGIHIANSCRLHSRTWISHLRVAWTATLFWNLDNATGSPATKTY